MHVVCCEWEQRSACSTNGKRMTVSECKSERVNECSCTTEWERDTQREGAPTLSRCLHFTANYICNMYVTLFGLLILGTAFSKFITAVQIHSATVRRMRWSVREKRKKKQKWRSQLLSYWLHCCFVFLLFSISSRVLCRNSTHWVTVNWDMHDLCASKEKMNVTIFFLWLLFSFCFYSAFILLHCFSNEIKYSLWA